MGSQGKIASNLMKLSGMEKYIYDVPETGKNVTRDESKNRSLLTGLSTKAMRRKLEKTSKIVERATCI
jgi:hypothetical protein